MKARTTIKRAAYKRPTRDEMEARLDAIYAIVRDIEPCGVRQGFYQAVVRGLMDKSEFDYDKVQRALVKMRRDGRVPYGWIVDGTRWMHKPASYSSLEQALKRTARNLPPRGLGRAGAAGRNLVGEAGAGGHHPAGHRRVRRAAVRVARLLQSDLSG